VYLIGPMGSGKTTIGQRVAQLLELEFLDCDHELEAQTGASVSLIFDVEGEEGRHGCSRACPGAVAFSSQPAAAS
jgi:shikimate kinase